MSLRTTLSDAAVNYVRTCVDPPTIDEIIEHLMYDFRADIEAEGERAKREFVRSAAKSGLSEKPTVDDQLTLPGFHLPTTISIPVDEGRVVYVAIENATREQAHAHTIMKDANIGRAVEERQKWGDFLDRLEPVWQLDPCLTIGDCIRRLNA